MIAEKDGPIGRLIFKQPGAPQLPYRLEMWQAVTQIMDDFEEDDAVAGHRRSAALAAGAFVFLARDISEFKERRASEEAGGLPMRKFPRVPACACRKTLKTDDRDDPRLLHRRRRRHSALRATCASPPRGSKFGVPCGQAFGLRLRL